MKIASCAIISLVLTSQHVAAFAPLKNSQIVSSVSSITNKLSTSLASAAPSDVESVPLEEFNKEGKPLSPIMKARNELLETAKELTDRSPTGLFITVPADRNEFMKAVARLEAIAPPTNDTFEPLMIGDWELVATAKKSTIELLNQKSSNDKKLSLPKLNPKLKNSFSVTQRIRTANDDPTLDSITRVDNVIEFDNEKEVEKPFLPAFLNPLKLSDAKLVLVHKAKVKSYLPFRINIQNTSIVLNVAGTSQQLTPEGADIFGVNVPSLTEWMNAGDFDTTYLDENVRISRGTIGVLEETRVFVKKGFDIDAIMSDDYIYSTPEETQIEKIASAVGDVAESIGSLANDVKDTIEKDIEGIKEDIDAAVDDVKTVVKDDMEKVVDAVSEVKSAVINDEELEKAVDDAVEAVVETGKDVQESVEEGVKNLTDTVKDDVDKLKEKMEDLGDKALKTPETETEDDDNDDDESESADE